MQPIANRFSAVYGKILLAGLLKGAVIGQQRAIAIIHSQFSLALGMEVVPNSLNVLIIRGILLVLVFRRQKVIVRVWRPPLQTINARIWKLLLVVQISLHNKAAKH